MPKATRCPRSGSCQTSARVANGSLATSSIPPRSPPSLRPIRSRRPVQLPRMDPTPSDSARALDRYRLLSQHARDIVLFIRPDDGRIVEANHAAVAAYAVRPRRAADDENLRPPRPGDGPPGPRPDAPGRCPGPHLRDGPL